MTSKVLTMAHGDKYGVIAKLCITNYSNSAWVDVRKSKPNYAQGTVWLRFMFPKAYPLGVVWRGEICLPVTPSDIQKDSDY